MPLRNLGPRAAALLLFCVLFGLYATSRVRIQTDSIWTVPAASSLLHRGDVDLDEYAPTFQSYTPHGVRRLDDGRHLPEYPLGPVLAALPFVALTDVVVKAPGASRSLRAWDREFHATGRVDLGFFANTELRIAALYVAAAAAVLLLALRRKVSPRGALATALLFGLGTAAYSTASRVLWQHAPSLLCLALLVLLLTRERLGHRAAALAGLVAALAYVCRPTNAVTCAVLTVYVALAHRRLLPAFLGGAALVAAPFLAFNLHTYGGLFSPYYAVKLSLGPWFLTSLAAQLASPSRGLFVYSPFLLFALGAVAVRLHQRSMRGVDWAFLAIPVVHWLAVAAFPIWWAGHSVGARFLTDVLPFLCWFLAEPVDALLSAPRERPVATAALALTALFAVFIHWRASTTFWMHRWNSEPVNVDDAPHRALVWSDTQLRQAFRFGDEPPFP